VRTIAKRLDQLFAAGRRRRYGKAWPAEALPLIKACERLRDHVRAYIRANIRSWETGNVEAHR